MLLIYWTKYPLTCHVLRHWIEARMIFRTFYSHRNNLRISWIFFCSLFSRTSGTELERHSCWDRKELNFKQSTRKWRMDKKIQHSSQVWGLVLFSMWEYFCEANVQLFLLLGGCILMKCASVQCLTGLSTEFIWGRNFTPDSWPFIH